jgi:hypothetical protein
MADGSMIHRRKRAEGDEAGPSGPSGPSKNPLLIDEPRREPKARGENTIGFTGSTGTTETNPLGDRPPNGLS